MYIVIILIAILAAILMVLIVVVQNSKGGGLSSTFGASSIASQVMGTRRTTDAVEKVTWYLFGIIVLLTFVANFALPEGTADQYGRSSKLEKGIEGMNIQDMPTTAPDMNNLQNEEGGTANTNPE
jgi:preprotein translocase subunit SecG